jgi:hypothetical protein
LKAIEYPPALVSKNKEIHDSRLFSLEEISYANLRNPDYQEEIKEFKEMLFKWNMLEINQEEVLDPENFAKINGKSQRIEYFLKRQQLKCL